MNGRSLVVGADFIAAAVVVVGGEDGGAST